MSMPALARADRILLGILLVGALLAALLHWLLTPPEKTGGFLRQPSTFFNSGSGTKATYDVLGELKYPVTRLRRRISSESLEGVGVVFVMRPIVGLAREEIDALQDWVEEGHALIVVPGSPLEDFEKLAKAAHAAKGVHDEDFPEDWFNLVPVPKDPVPKDLAAESESPTGPPKTPAELLPVMPSPTLQKIEASGPLTAGIAELAVPEGRRFDPKSPCRGHLQDAVVKVFWKDPRGTIGLTAALGDGTVVALADDYPLTNLGISQGDNGLLLANVVREMSARYPGKVAFDEFHLGFGEHEFSPLAIIRLMAAGPWRWAAFQAALVGVLALFAQAVRFGSPLGVVLKPRRQHREFAEAAGRLFEEAGATSLAAETLYRYYRERFCKLLLVDSQVEDQQLREAVERRAGAAVAAELLQAQATLSQGPAARQGALSRQKLLAFSQKLQRVAEALDHGT